MHGILSDWCKNETRFIYNDYDLLVSLNFPRLASKDTAPKYYASNCPSWWWKVVTWSLVLTLLMISRKALKQNFAPFKPKIFGELGEN